MKYSPHFPSVPYLSAAHNPAYFPEQDSERRSLSDSPALAGYNSGILVPICSRLCPENLFPSRKSGFSIADLIQTFFLNLNPLMDTNFYIKIAIFSVFIHCLPILKTKKEPVPHAFRFLSIPQAYKLSRLR